MKKYIAFIMTAILVLGSFAACGKDQVTEKSEKLSIVTTIFPEYDWVREILGAQIENANVSMLLDSGVDLHSFQPTAEDILKITTCDLFVYVGGESDEWVEDTLVGVSKPNMEVINLLEVLGDSAKEEELIEGMEGEEEEEGEKEEGAEYDEHVWLSLKNAKMFVTAISDALCKLDADHAATYRVNAATYSDKLTALDAKYQSAVEAGTQNTLLFADRFPFRYMVDDYGLQYYAAFIGCSAETEASFETITFLSGKVNELGLHSIMALEGTDHKIAQTVIQNTANKNQQVLELNSMQSITAKDVQAGAQYLSIMQSNLDTLTDALR